MKIAYLDCASGISGDMMLGALIDAGVELEPINRAIGSLGWSNVRLRAETVKKKGFRATQITVEHEPESKHRHLHHIHAMLDRGTLSARQNELARKIFQRLAEAEAAVHGTTIEKVHFHEVGAVDSICDIVGVAVGWDLLGAERLLASPVPTGHGFIEIAHGRCSIPAPATAELLRGVPLAASHVACELTTPTGAAILAGLADGFGPLPAMTIEQIGYGAGQTDLAEQANVLRLLVGTTGAMAPGRAAVISEQLVLLETNLDDASGEQIGHAIERLWAAGALDVYTTAIQMKKNRPGVLLSVLATPEQAVELEWILFRETPTLGVRQRPLARTRLPRRRHEVATVFGTIAGVLAELPDGSQRFSPEYESCRQCADTAQQPLAAIYDAARRAFGESQAR